MTIEYAAATDIGRNSDHNEDSVLTTSLEWGVLLAVADGMGGHAGGDIASETALDAFKKHLKQTAKPDKGEIPGILRTAVTKADEAVHETAITERGAENMGTTLVAAVITDETAILVNVGDSRGYHLAGSSIEQVTVDHSLVQELVAAGEITPVEAENHPQRNIISQFLGSDDEIEPDTFHCDLDGTLLLCSDGLTEEVPDDKISEIVAQHSDLEATVSALIDQANENGGSDNISVALGRYT